MRLNTPIITRLDSWLQLGWLVQLLWALSAGVGASENNEYSIVQADTERRISLTSQAMVFEDNHAELMAADALDLYQRGVFYPLPTGSLQFAYRKSVIWLGYALRNDSAERIQRYLEVRYSPLDEVDLYLVDSASNVVKQYATGDNRPYGQKPYDGRSYVAPLDLNPQSDYQLLVRVRTTSTMSIPIYLSSPQSLYEYEHVSQILLGIFYGIAVGLFIYNFFLLFVTRSRIYFFYIVYLGTYALFMASMDGLLFQFWPESFKWESLSIYLFSWISCLFMIFFCRDLLRTKRHSKVSDYLLKVLSFIVVACLLFMAVSDDLVAIARINGLLIGGSSIVLLIVMLTRLLQGNREAAYSIVGMASFFVGTLSVALGSMNVHSYYLEASVLLKVGSNMEMVLFSIALAYRINRLQLSERLALESAEHALREAHINNSYMEKINEVNERLEQALEAKSAFLANMSHEIRTPMNGILGMVSMAKDTDLNPEQRNYLEVAERSGKTLLALINDVLDLSKIEAGKLEIETIDFNLDQLVSDLKNLYGMQLKDKGLEFSYFRQTDVPLWIKQDHTRLWQILSNLIGNAIKFTDEGRIAIHIEIINGDTLLIQVMDTGIGIDEQAQEKIFSSFTQADNSTTREYGGTGLGLSISSKLAELMGGELTVESEKGIGSSFKLSMPLVEGIPPSDANHTYSDDEGVVTESCEGLHVLLVEDNKVNQMVAQGMLKKLKVTMDTANDGLEGVDLATKNTYDLILMDMQMPNMDGIEATQLIIARAGPNQHTPIIAMTANVMDSDKKACIEAGMKDHLSKPVDIDSLHDMMIKWKRR